jgi:hypothetical protein
MTRDFDGLTSALAAWGKYNEFPFKLRAARAAYEAMVALRGVPASRDVSGRAPFYIVSGGQYVAVLWEGLIGLSFQAGFMAGTEQLTKAWVLSPRPKGDGNRGATWWRYEFPDHVRFTNADASPDTRFGECACSPGMRQPVRSRCSYCDEAIVR